MKKIILFNLMLLFMNWSINAQTATPVISSFSPLTGSVGTLITITGSGLESPTSFIIGGTPAIIISNTGTSLVGMVMPGAVTGNVNITTAGGTATSPAVFTVTATPYPTLQQGNKLVGTNPVGDSKQGKSVAISADGNTAIVGGETDNSENGAFWFYTRSGDVWTQQGNKLTVNDATGQPRLGTSIALSADGNTAIVGGSWDNNSVGAAWVFVRAGNSWTQQGSKLVASDAIGAAMQGQSVSLSADGNTAIVGGGNDNNIVGAAWIYTRNGNTWTQQGKKLVGTGINGGIAFQGVSVALSADGNTAIVGGSGDNFGVGAIWIYSCSGNTWTQQGGKLVGTGVTGVANLGYSVSLSADGNTAIVGGPFDNSNAGSVWVYIRNGNTWIQQGDKLVGTGASGSATQGRSVSLSADGNTAIVGGPGDNSYFGASWVYTRAGNTWTQKGSKLIANDATPSANYGTSLSLSSDGNTAIIGGVGDGGTGAAWIFIPSVTLPASVSIAAVPAGAICAGTSVTFTATPVNGGTPSYQWMKNGTPIAEMTESVYTTNTLENGDEIAVVMTSSLSDITGSPATSNSIVAIVNSLPMATIGVSGPTTFCQGGSVVLTASEGSTYLWNTEETTQTISVSTSGTYTVTITNAENCSATSEAVTVTVNTSPAAPTGSATQSFYSSNSPTVADLAATGNNIQWYSAASDGVPLPLSTTLVNGTHYYASQTVNECESTARLDVLVSLSTTSETMFSTSGTFNVPAGVTQIKVQLWGGGGRGGSGYNNPFGGGGGGAYSSGTLNVTSGTSYSVQVGLGQTSSNYQPGGDSWFGTQTTVLAKGGASCSNIETGGPGGLAASGYGDIKFSGGKGADALWDINGFYSGGGGSSAGTDANGAVATNAQGAVAPTDGGNGGNGIDNTNITIVSGPGSPGFVPGGGGGGALNYYTGSPSYGGSGANGQVIVSWEAGCGTPPPTANAQSFCITDDPLVSDLEVSGEAGATFSWYEVPEGGSPLSDNTSLTTGNYYVSQTVADCQSARTTVSVTVNPVLPVSVSIVSSDGEILICAGEEVTFTATPINGGASPSYQWWKNGSAVDGQVAATYIFQPVNSDAVYVVMGSSAACISGSPATSNVITMTVTPPPQPGVITGPVSAIIVGATLQLSATGGDPSGTWASTNTEVATVSTTGLVTGVGVGAATIIYKVTGLNECEGVTDWAEYPVKVGIPVSATFTSSTTFTVPADVTSINSKAWGGGGGAAGRNTYTSYAGGGGGGGGFRGGTLSVSPGDKITVTVGQGGPGGSVSSPNGSLGASSIVSHSSGTITATGGSGPNAGAGWGYGGDGSFTGTVTNQRGYRGGDGGYRDSYYASSGGGGGAGDANNGATGSVPGGGNGGSAGGGRGGDGSTTEAPGGDGSGYGGGGGGGSSVVNSTGGNGANGGVIISWISYSCEDAKLALSSAGSNMQAVCANTAITPIVYTVGGGATGASVSPDLPTGLTGIYNAGTYTISGSVATGIVYNYTVSTTGTTSPCTTATATGTITVTSTPSAPGISVQNNCGSSILTATGYTGTLQWNTGETTASITVSTGGTYSVTQTVNGCTSSAGETTVTIIASPVATPTVLGDGSSGDPYQIATLENLYWVASNATVWNKHFIQTAYIDASATAEWCTGGWLPIGDWYENDQTGNRVFSGSYDGQGHTISGLYITNNSAYVAFGLFGRAQGATIKNLGIINVQISGVAGSAGALVGSSVGCTFENCYSTGSLAGTSKVGGLVGENTQSSSITNCYSSCAVVGTSQVGGLTGTNSSNSTIIYSYHDIGTVDGSGSYTSMTGGLVGANHGASISKCYSTGTVAGYDYTGGLVGYNYSSATISDSYSRSSCSGHPSYGYNSGGLVGYNHLNSMIINCYSTGLAGALLGGLLGYQSDGATTVNSFWDTETSGKTYSDGGTGKPTVEMKTVSTFTDAGWDFTTIWGLDAGNNDGYPYFLPVSACANGTIVLSSAQETDNQTVCANTAITPIVYTVGGGAKDAGVIGLPEGVNGSYNIGTFTISGTSTVAGTYEYTVTTSGTTSPCEEASAKGTIIVVDPNASPGVISGPATACAGETEITYSVETVTGATSYNWDIPTDAVITEGSGTNSIKVTFSSESGSVSVTATTPCGITSASTKQVTVNPTFTPTVNITSSDADNKICLGTIVTFTATTANTGGGTVAYKWFLNENSYDNEGWTQSTWTHSDLDEDGYDLVRCEITVTGGTCLTSAKAVSNIIDNDVYYNFPLPSVSITSSAPDNTICEGAGVTFTAIPANTGGGTVAYVWIYKGIRYDLWGSSWTATELKDGDRLSCEITVSNGACFPTATATSNEIVTTVISKPSVTIVSDISGDADIAICAGTSVTFTATPLNLNGGTVAYTWAIYKNDKYTFVGTDQNTYTSSSLQGGDGIICGITVTGGSCPFTNPAPSNLITVTVNPLHTASIIGGSQFACESTMLTAATDAATPTFTWYRDDLLILAEEGPTVEVTQAGNYSVQVTESSTGCMNTSEAFTVSEVSQMPFNRSVKALEPDVCTGSEIIIVLIDSEAGVSYQLREGENINTGEPILGNGDDIRFYPGVFDVAPTFSVLANRGYCSIELSDKPTVNILDDTQPTITSVTADPTIICIGSITTLTVSGSLNGATEWNWYTSGCGVDGAFATGASITVSPTESWTYYVRGEGGCSYNDNCSQVTVTVVEMPVAGTIIKTPDVETICEGSGVYATFAESSGGVSCTDTYEYRYEGTGDWSSYTPEEVLSTGGHTLVEIRTQRGGCQAGCSTDTKTVSWTIGDSTPPVVVTKDIIVQLNADGLATIAPLDVDGGSYDNCGIESMSLDITSFGCDNVGTPVTVELTVTDAKGNSASNTAIVTVQDKIAPEITCVTGSPFTRESSENNIYYTVSGNEFDAVAEDACGIYSLTYECLTALVSTGTTLAGVQLPIGKNTINWSANDNNGNTTFCQTVVDVQKRWVKLTYTGDLTEQYTDEASLKALLVDKEGNPASEKTIKFTIGDQWVTGKTGIDGIATATLILNQSPVPSYTVRAEFEGDASCMPASDQDPFDIAQENAVTAYTGNEFVGEQNPNASTTPLVLSATLTDVDDSYRGDIRNARVQFYDVNTLAPLSEWLTPGLVMPGDITQGSVTHIWNAPVPTSGYNTFTIGVKVGTKNPEGNGYYLGSDKAVVNVFRTELYEFITGGGHIIPIESKGTYASDPGRKVNFGFNVKWNKTMNRLQGNLNLIFRNGDKVYQIKANSMTSLSINSFNPCSQQAVFTSKANLTDVTLPALPVELKGNLSLQVTMTNNTSPGATSTIGFTVYDGNTLLYSSSWPVNQTAELPLAAGNIIVHNGIECIVNNKVDVMLYTSVNPSFVGDEVIFKAVVTPKGSALIPEGTIVFKDGDDEIGTVLLGSGMATLAVSDLAVGIHQITAEYFSTNDFENGISNTVTQQVKSAVMELVSDKNPSATEELVTFTATVSASAAGDLPSGTVIFKDGTSEIGTVTLTGGVASLSTAVLTTGIYTITAEYSGNYGPLTATMTQTVSSNVNITLVSSKNPQQVNTPVSFTASVTASGSPVNGADVSFRINGVFWMTVATDVNGKAVVNNTFKSAGTYIIEANSTGQSASFSQVIKTKVKSASIVAFADNSIEMPELKVYPNPFSNRLFLEFVSPVDAKVRIEIFDITGRSVETVFNSIVEAGVTYTAEFIPERIIDGIYLYRMNMGEDVFNGKVVFNRR